ncbi:MAG: glycosyltransferase [Verrucomicrobiota bacterium]
MADSQKPTLSFIVPAMNEEETIRTLFDGIKEFAEPVSRDFEVVFIDDGSSDGTWAEMEALVAEYPDHVKAIQHRRNFGKANALAVGYREVIGELVFTMDADLQDDPAEIPRFIEKIEGEQLDIVSGYKEKRYDPWHKVLPSRVFNPIISSVSGVKLHDHNCGFKCYRNDVVKTLPMYGGMHRMVPSIAGIFGFKTGEIVVQHHPRRHGVSKYGAKRILHGIADIITVGFIKNYRDQPNHALAITAFIMASIAIAVAVGMSFVPAPQIVSHLVEMLTTAGITSAFVLLFLGILAEFDVWRSLMPSGNHQISYQLGRHQERVQVAESQEAKQKRALVADDDPVVSKVLSNILRKQGWSVVRATDVDSAVEALEAGMAVAFVDVHMPGPKHQEAVRRLQEKSPETRIVSVSSDECDRVSNNARHAGAATFLQKPIKPRDVLEQANKALGGAVVAGSEAAEEEAISLAR